MQLEQYLLPGNFINPDRAKEFLVEIIRDGKLNYVWYQQLDKMTITEASQADINFSKLLEARFFNQEMELHIFSFDDKLKIYIKKKNADSKYIEEEQILRSKYGTKIKFRHYISEDEDGQAYITLTCLCDYLK